MNGVNPLGVATPVSSATAVVELLRAAIVDGRLVPNQDLREGQLAGQLGVSRTPVREALRTLAADGLVAIVPNRGAVVRLPSREELADMYRLRAVIEGYAAACAAEQISRDAVYALHESCERFHALSARDRVVPLVKENLAFHAIVHEASASPRTPLLVRGLLELPLLYSAYAAYTPERRGLSERHHREITAALERRDPSAAEAVMKEHILAAGTAALRAIDSNADDIELTLPS